MLLSAIIATGLSWWKPIINAFVLMLMSVPTMIMLYTELQRYVNKYIHLNELPNFQADKQHLRFVDRFVKQSHPLWFINHIDILIILIPYLPTCLSDKAHGFLGFYQLGGRCT